MPNRASSRPLDARLCTPAGSPPAGVALVGWTGGIDRGRPIINRNLLFLIVGALSVAVLVLGYQWYREQQKTGIQIDVGKDGVTVETK